MFDLVVDALSTSLEYPLAEGDVSDRLEDPSHEVANRLAALLRPFPWYQRTSVLEEKYLDDGRWRWRIVLRVWGCWRRGKTPAEIPATFGGLDVVACRTSRTYPCPFGSRPLKGETP